MANSVLGSQGTLILIVLGALVFGASFGGYVGNACTVLLALLLVDVLYDLGKAEGWIQ